MLDELVQRLVLLEVAQDAVERLAGERATLAFAPCMCFARRIVALYAFLEEELEEVVTEDGEPVGMVCMSDASIAFDEALAFFRVEPIAVLVGDAAARLRCSRSWAAASSRSGWFLARSRLPKNVQL